MTAFRIVVRIVLTVSALMTLLGPILTDTGSIEEPPAPPEVEPSEPDERDRRRPNRRERRVTAPPAHRGPRTGGCKRQPVRPTVPLTIGEAWVSRPARHHGPGVPRLGFSTRHTPKGPS